MVKFVIRMNTLGNEEIVKYLLSKPTDLRQIPRTKVYVVTPVFKMGVRW